MPITKANQHVPVGAATTYCSAADLDVHLAGVAADDDGNILGAFLERAKVDAKLDKLLAIAKLRVDQMAKRDFLYHENVDIMVDGPNAEVLLLAQLGFVPLLDLTALTIDDTPETLADYVFYEDGRVMRKTFTSDETVVSSSTLRAFPYGRQNIGMTVSWGYTAVPLDVEMAAAYVAGYFILRQLVGVPDLRTPGAGAYFQQIQYGDLRISQGQRNPLLEQANALMADAKNTLRAYKTPRVTSPDPSAASAISMARREHFTNW